MPDHLGEMPDGKAIHALTLTGGGLTARLLTLGAVVQDLRLKGVDHPLVLGSPDPMAYLGPMAHVGAVVGRFANRIARARFDLDGASFRLDANWRGHCLHGGAAGASLRLWQIVDHGRDHATLALHLPDGDMGFPGALDLRLSVTLGAGLCFDMAATSDRATPCSFAHHGYLRLDDGPDLSHHRLRLNAPDWLEVDADLIPTGRILPATGALDFREPRSLRGVALDHAFGLPQGPGLRPVAWLESDSGLSMTMETTAPGLQLYTAQHFPASGLPGHAGRRYGPQAGLALEAQEWPDAPNHPHFPPAILRPGATWRQTTRFTFSPAPKGPS